jgi:LPPG:FO 2-phospho-L-lactate transferase
VSGRVVVLTGGVGGAKLVDGLYRILPPDTLTAIVNTGDDFIHYGLPISPDIDTLLYTLSGLANRAQGWGREGESWSFMAAFKTLGGETWFNLGDGDLALHVMRGAALAGGQTLSQVTKQFAQSMGLALTIIPMADSAVSTWLDTDEGRLPFQRYFVERQCAPKVSSIAFEGADAARVNPLLLEAIAEARVIFIAPSNPWLSVDPILAIPAIRSALAGATAPIVAVSPLVGGKAVKGPTAKLMGELGFEISNQSIATHYEGLLKGVIVHVGDDEPNGVPCLATNTLMTIADDRIRVARVALKFAASL